jgi:head-tail adaptor
MSFGKMNTTIDIFSNAPTKDSEGFATETDTVLATIQAYKEDRHGTERWANMSVFSDASTLFRFRKIPDLVVDTTMGINVGDDHYRILSVEDVRGRGMYIEILAELLKPSMR